MSSYTTFFGDGEKTFALTFELICELERLTGSAIGVFYAKFINANFHFNDLVEIIRLGLIGGGTAPAEAQNLVNLYVKTRPVMESFPIAFEVLERAMNGAEDEPETEENQTEIPDMEDAINDALEQVAP